MLGSERLYADIQRDLSSEQVQIIQLPKSGGVVGRDQYLRRRLQEMQLRCYFYGSDGNLNPFTTVVNFDQVHIVRIGTGLHVPATALPLGAQSTLDPLQISEVTPSTELLHSILGVSQAENEETIVDSPVYGFVHVTKVCMSFCKHSGKNNYIRARCCLIVYRWTTRKERYLCWLHLQENYLEASW